MKIAIYIRQHSADSEEIMRQLQKLLLGTDEVVLIDETTRLDHSVEVVLTIGGDGTLLKGITYVRDLEIPILGINAGRLGFLATAHKDRLAEVVEQLRNKSYSVIERSVIEAVYSDNGEIVDPVNFALNEISVTRKNTASMITIDTELGNEFLSSYWADGLIIATPTGSTGYSLSCGGPVIVPTAKNLVITPIAPHNLNARPLVIPEDTEVKLTVSGREQKYLLSMDSHIKSMPNERAITVRKASFVVKMICLKGDSFVKTLRNKLLWGEDKRNK
jgi:probable inorganic polyphosphate/ATP-NAD kinase